MFYSYLNITERKYLSEWKYSQAEIADENIDEDHKISILLNQLNDKYDFFEVLFWKMLG